MGYSVKMKRLIISMALALVTAAALGAQAEQPADAPKEKPKSNFEYEPIRKGDQNIGISIGPAFSLFNIGGDGADTNMEIGGIGSIRYNRYLNSRVALGGGIDFAFNPTLGENLYFYLPIVFGGTYTFVFDRIQVPLSLMGGFAFQTYNDRTYFGPILKPSAEIWFQYSPEWSYGLSAAWSVIPQFYEDSSNNRTGNFADIKAGFRYHF
jgi:hypothetical protein